MTDTGRGLGVQQSRTCSMLTVEGVLVPWTGSVSAILSSLLVSSSGTAD